MTRSRFARCLCVLFVLFSASISRASTTHVLTVNERVAESQTVVVATATEITPRWAVNAHGDQLIVSRVRLRVEEALKGQAADVTDMEVEGGTLNGVTLRVSSFPEMRSGDRAVLFLDKAGTVHVPHARGQGILKIDDNNIVKGSRISLDDIRRVARAAAR